MDTRTKLDLKLTYSSYKLDRFKNKNYKASLIFYYFNCKIKILLFRRICMTLEKD